VTRAFVSRWGQPASHDLLMSGFCLDCLSYSRAVWGRCLRNVFGLLRAGGSFVVLSLRACRHYRVGAQWFPAANIRLADLRSAILKCGADPARLVVLEHDLPNHARQGYEGMLLACGQTRVSK
jgi:hypothetical protein